MSTLDRAKLKSIIESQGKTPRAVSRDVGDNAYLVRDILSGKSKNPRSDTLAAITRALGVPLHEILSDQDGASAGPPGDPRIVPTMLPVRYRVQAGHWLEMDQSAQVFQGPSQPVSAKAAYAEWPQWLELVVGDSINLRIPDGGFAHVVDAIGMGYSARDGDLVVVERRRDGGALCERTIKEVKLATRAIELWPRSTNPEWNKPVVLNGGTSEGGDIEVEIVGLVIGAYTEFR